MDLVSLTSIANFWGVVSYALYIKWCQNNNMEKGMRDNKRLESMLKESNQKMERLVKIGG